MLPIMPKFPEISGPNANGTVWPRWKFSAQSGPPPEVVLLDWSVRSVRAEIAVPFSEIFVSSFAPARHYTQLSEWWMVLL